MKDDFYCKIKDHYYCSNNNYLQFHTCVNNYFANESKLEPVK